MTGLASRDWLIFRMLCRVLGGQDKSALTECDFTGQIPQLVDMAQGQNLLPALAVRCNEQTAIGQDLKDALDGFLKQALMENTQRNLQISAQALKFTKCLNKAGIMPLFLKGTARMLAEPGNDLGFRKQSDIDLIAQPAEIEAAGEAFLADGYSFCEFLDSSTPVPLAPGDTVSAMEKSAAHHHLPALVKPGYAATVELHRHYLPRRFQRGNPLGPLFGSARQITRHGATFLVPSTEFQLTHLILGKLVHDGYQARRTFPIREACDLIDILESAEGEIDLKLVERCCGRSFGLFLALVSELMVYRPKTTITEPVDASKYIQMLQKRFDSPATGKWLDASARIQHLAYALVYSPAKLPAYMGRIKRL